MKPPVCTLISRIHRLFIIIRTKNCIYYIDYSILLYNSNQVNSVWPASGDNAQGRHIFRNGGDMCASRHLLCTAAVLRIIRTKHTILKLAG